jgi:hypothetical protein
MERMQNSRVLGARLSRAAHALADPEKSGSGEPRSQQDVIVSIVSIVLVGGCTDPAWSHPNSAAGAKLAPMIQFDQFLIAMAVCFVAAHLLTAA